MMADIAEKFIDLMGRHLEEEGVPRIAGRLMGALLLNSEPSTLDDLADQLQVSKASISSNARMLERWGIADRVTVAGDRRDFYQIAANAEERVLLRQIERNRLMLERLKVGVNAVPADHGEVRARLESMIDFVETCNADLERQLDRTRVPPV